MEPRIQYAKTSDGVNIACYAAGDGVPLVIAPNLAGCHLQTELRMPDANVLDKLAQHAQIIRYDCRGMGMSQRDAIDFSMGAAERDLDAVVDKLGLETFALFGCTLNGPAPFYYAAHHPERVRAFVYWAGHSVRGSPEIMRQIRLIQPLAEQDWELYHRIRARVMHGWDSPLATAFAELVIASHSRESFRQALEVLEQSMYEQVPEGIVVPTLVLHLQDSTWTATVARAVASRVSSAHVLAIPGSGGTRSPYLYDNEVWVAAIADFINGSWHSPEVLAAPELRLSAMRAILWTDLEAHSAMMERLGDARGRDVLREHERLTREALSAHGGTEVKAMGDGFMAWFRSAQQALDCATALQRSIAAHNATTNHPLSVRVGVNAGEPIAEEDDLFGASVIAAARICREAAGGEIVVSDVVRQLVAGKSFHFAERGAVALKGFEEPIRLFEVRWREDG